MMDYKEFKRKKDQLVLRKGQLKQQIEMVNKSLQQLKMQRLKGRIDNMKIV